jgi:hypothetical protein
MNKKTEQKGEFDDLLAMRRRPQVEPVPNPEPIPESIITPISQQSLEMAEETRKAGRPRTGKRSSETHTSTTPWVEQIVYEEVMIQLRRQRKKHYHDYGDLVNDLLKRWLEENGVDISSLQNDISTK